MKRKPDIQGNGLAFSEMLYGSENIPTTAPKNNCICDPNPAKHGRNMAAACRSVQSDSKVAQKVLEAFQEQYCTECHRQFKQSFWKEMERENE